jgi:hypothetical protein
MKPFWEQIREDVRRNTKSLLVFWSVGALVVILGFVVLWAWTGPPHGPGGLGRAILQVLVIAVVLPPVVWLIGKVIS